MFDVFNEATFDVVTLFEALYDGELKFFYLKIKIKFEFWLKK